jgi:hypothetical protein
LCTGCTEHHLKLLSMLVEARRKQKSLNYVWPGWISQMPLAVSTITSFDTPSVTIMLRTLEMVEMISSLYVDLELASYPASLGRQLLYSPTDRCLPR